MKKLLFVLVLIGFKFSFGQVSISMHNTDYNTNFNSWNASLPTGFSHSGSGSAFRGSSAPDTQGGTYSVSNSGYGYQPSGTASALTLTGTFRNSTGSTITELEVSYEAFSIFHRTSRLPSWSVSSSLGAVGSLTWAYNSSASAGSPDVQTITLSGLNIANNATFTFTFSSDRGSGSGSSPKIGLNNIKVRSISAPPCSISASGLANLTCNDNATSGTSADDFLTFDLDPTGASIGASYNVSVSAGTITPTSGTYGSSTAFTLNNGSAGGGDVIVTITDAVSGTCTLPVNIVDPGVCSVPCTPVTGTDVQTACGSFDWIDGNTYTSSNNTATFTIANGAANGCDSIVTLDLTINNPTTGTDVQTACGSFDWIDGNTYTSSNNTATFTIANGAANGCDSIVTLDLTINNPTTGTDVQTACGSFDWIDGNTYTSSNNTATFTIANGAANGCDSIVTLDLTINNPTTGTDVQTACGSFDWIDGNTYTSSNNTATFTIANGAANGCDSIVTLDLTINNSTTGTATETACDSYTWVENNNTVYTASGVYTATLQTAAGCDSVVTLDLTINNSTTGTATETACDSYTWVENNNTVYTASGIYTATLQTAAGCDSVVTLDLTINNSTTGTATETACDSYTWVENNNTVYTASGIYTATLQTAAGCDSVVTLDLTINNSTTGTATETACDSYTWVENNNTVYTASGIYTATLQTASGCDSVVTLDLTINNSTTGTATETACDSYTWVENNNTVYTTSGVYTATLQTAAGCDSVVTLDLTINNSTTGTATETACDSYTWVENNNTVYTASGVYTATLQTAAGCDSVVTLDLTINNSTTGTATETACDSYTWVENNNTVYTASGVYTATLQTAAGCDSVVTLDLTINNSTIGTATETACDSYTWVENNNTVYTTSGIYTATLQTAAGCDSVVTLDLTINNSTTGTATETACDSYTWVENNNTVYTASGIYTATLQNAAGCDSVVTLDLTINNSTTGTATETACDSYTWVENNNTVYTASGVYTATLQTAAGCDSVVTLDLTINNSSAGSENVTACGFYTWSANNTTYNASGVYTATLQTAAGCDSIATLNLTINTPTAGTDVQAACGSFDWIDGNTYTSSNNTATFTIAGGAANGCDSIVTLNLTISNPTAGTDVQTACVSFDWIDGNTYTSSNNTATFTIAGGAANGCDSIVTLDLTINTVDVSVTPNDPSITANAANATFQWINCSNNSDIVGALNATFTATANGSYAVEVTENGCVDTSSCVSIVTVGLEENFFNDVNVYPNPNNGQFTISFGEVERPSVSVYTVDGKLVYLQEEVNEENVSIELVNEPGVYFITISKGEYNYSTRVIVQ